MYTSLTTVHGIQCWGAHTGVKSKRRDLALIYSEEPASAAAVFTRNLVRAEPIKISQEHIKNGKAQAFVINSGNANACTGEQGRKGAQKMASQAAQSMKIPEEDVIISSTGVIGRQFPTEKILKGIRENVRKLSKRDVAGSFVSNAILTTDTFPKEGATDFTIGRKNVNLAGVAKGSGMIHPNMGTMLAFIVSDLAISPHLADKALREAVDLTFNMISVDGDTSTNDMVALMCNGRAENSEITSEGPYYQKFKTELIQLCQYLSQAIVSDGEGATKFIEYHIKNAPTVEDARKVARTISDSKLVKTAFFGRDPNWGRIVAAAGRAGVNYNPDKIDLSIGTNKMIPVIKDGNPDNNVLTRLKKMLKASSVKVEMDLKAGDAEATAWGTDLSYEYVRINAAYTS